MGKAALHFLIFGFILAVSGFAAGESQNELILLDLKRGFDDPYGVLSSWKENDISPCRWTGITCDVTQKFVEGIDLSSMNVSGPFPTVVCRLDGLKNLSLANNYINGSIPADLRRCKQLELLDLSQNLLVGELPNFISELSSLRHLDLSGNNFSGSIPPAFGNLTELRILNLFSNLLNATVPAYVGNLSNLVELNLAYNSLTGTLPPELGNLTKLQNLWLAGCSFEGEIPTELGNLAELTNFDLSQNRFKGSIPESITKLRNVVQIELYENRLTGPIPAAMEDLKALKRFDASSNMLDGPIPAGLGSLNLESLNLYENRLTGEIPAGFGSFNLLTELKLFTNNLTGQLPQNLGRYSPLETLDIANNNLFGSLPVDLCKYRKLSILSIFNNEFSGALPEGLGSCSSLNRVRLGKNKFNGTVPPFLWGLPHVSLLQLQNNNFSGTISPKIANAKNLSQLDISGNKFSGTLPAEIGELWNLSEIVARENFISGSLPPSLGRLQRLGKLDLSNNLFSGELLSSVSKWQQMMELNLAKNQFTGSIPGALGSLPVLTYLDLSGNKLSGPIPPELGNLKLNIFNVSDNHLSGLVPVALQSVAYANSFVRNLGLCSKNPTLSGVNSCAEIQNESARRRGGAWLLRCLFALAGIIFMVGIAWFYRRYRGFAKTEGKSSMDKSSWMLTSFHRLGFSEYEILDCLDEDNVIGTGGAGKVYKATLSNGEIVAVKRLWSSAKSETASNDNGFKAEVDTLGKIRHKNIVKLWCCCTNRDSNLLVYEYMPNGSLGDLLHGPKASVLDWPIRYKIAVGAAQGLSYLHHDCVPAIIHRDVKSNNILLDGDFVAHVADFGLAKILQTCGRGTDSMSIIAGSYGYIAPGLAMAPRKEKRNEDKGKGKDESVTLDKNDQKTLEKAISALGKLAKKLSMAPEKVIQMMGMQSSGAGEASSVRGPPAGSATINTTTTSATTDPPNICRRSIGSRGIELKVKYDGTVFEDSNGKIFYDSLRDYAKTYFNATLDKSWRSQKPEFKQKFILQLQKEFGSGWSADRALQKAGKSLKWARDKSRIKIKKTAESERKASRDIKLDAKVWKSIYKAVQRVEQQRKETNEPTLHEKASQARFKSPTDRYTHKTGSAGKSGLEVLFFNHFGRIPTDDEMKKGLRVGWNKLKEEVEAEMSVSQLQLVTRDARDDDEHDQEAGDDNDIDLSDDD